MATIDGATLLARSLKAQGVDYMFGVPGFPIYAIAYAAQAAGVQFVNMRNEQSASYAAQVAGYLTGRPQACLTVTGPGVIHAIAGLANARQNCWPMVLVGGASPTYQNGMGAFQDEQQLPAVWPLCKYAAQVDRVARIPFYAERAVRTAFYGRPGPVYLDLPDDVLRDTIDEAAELHKPRVPNPPPMPAAQSAVEAALATLRDAERPLVIVGKGMAYGRAEHELRAFIERTQVPFLATPMGKGVLPDDHPLSTAAARSFVLQNADVIYLLGARFNWILHFGLPPRFAPDVKVVQLDIAPEAIGGNVPAAVALIGDGKTVLGQLGQALDADPWEYPAETRWRTAIADKVAASRATNDQLMDDDSTPMSLYRALRDIRDVAPRDAVIVNEGALTMDIGRQVLQNYEPRTRLDAGTYGTMGVGLGSAIAAAVVHPDRRVLCVQGDSAFGFSGMEVETAVRYNLPITFVVLNNSGIAGGGNGARVEGILPPDVYVPDAHYERVIEAFGGRGYFVDRPQELRTTLEAAMAEDKPALVNVIVSNTSRTKPQQFHWMSTIDVR